MKYMLGLMVAAGLSLISQVSAKEDDFWYWQQVKDPILEEVVIKRAILDGRSSEGDLWQLVIECNSHSDKTTENPLIVYLRSPWVDLWGGTRESSGTLIVLNGRAKTDQRPSIEKQLVAFSTDDSVTNNAVVWDPAGPLDKERWEEFRSQLRGETLNVWPFFKSAKLLMFRASATLTSDEHEIDLNEYYDRETKVTFNLGGTFAEGTSKYWSDVFIEKVESFCSTSISARQRYLDSTQ